MATQELRAMSLAEKIRVQSHLNQIRGDRKNFRGGKWKVYGRPISSYDRSFAGALGEADSIKDLLRGKKNPVVMDLLSPSDPIRSLFKNIPDQQKLGIAVSLEDRRSKRQKRKDFRSNIVQISGDLMHSGTWDAIEEALAGRKADLIMERADGGLGILPKELRLYGALLNKAWKLLSKDNGIIIFEIPCCGGEVYPAEAISELNKLKSRQIDVSIGGSSVRAVDFCYAAKLVRTSNSPEKLIF